MGHPDTVHSFTSTLKPLAETYFATSHPQLYSAYQGVKAAVGFTKDPLGTAQSMASDYFTQNLTGGYRLGFSLN